MWPAMWPGYPNPGANFFVDDPANQHVADEYGIVMSTSHHEPMQRLTNEWFLENEDGSWDWESNREKMTEFFHEGARRAKGCESYFTIGMRGEYDRAIKGSDPAAIISDVIGAQRKVIGDVYGSEDKIPRKYFRSNIIVMEEVSDPTCNRAFRHVSRHRAVIRHGPNKDPRRRHLAIPRRQQRHDSTAAHQTGGGSPRSKSPRVTSSSCIPSSRPMSSSHCD